MSFSVSSSMCSFPLSQLLSRSGDSTTAPMQKSAEEDFLEIAKKSPLERMRDKIMEDMKVSDESLAHMSAEQRTAVEDEIKRRIMESLQESTEAGQVVDKEA